MTSTSRRLALADVFADGRLAVMLMLGYAAGLPILLVFGTLSAWLRESGVPVTAIGLFSWLALAYSFKFVWSPVVDAVDVPVLSRLFGRRRAWMLLAQAVVVVGLAGVGLSDPGQNLAVTAVFAFLIAFGSATQDVVIDGWRIDAAPTSRQGLMAAAYQLGYRLALICAGAGALYIAEFVNWRAAYLSMAALMSVGMIASLLAPVPLSNVPPALAIMLIAFAYLEEDGVLLCAGLVLGVAMLAIAAAVAWETASTTGWVPSLL